MEAGFPAPDSDAVFAGLPVMFKPNPGKLPHEAKGKRVRVKLANGHTGGFEAVTPVSPVGWAADGPQGCRWDLSGHPFDIAEYEVIGNATP